MKIRKGFTLIELLVVISIMSMLMSILLPSLNRAREQGKRIHCLSNLRQLTLAWNMYAMDNGGKLCSSETSWNDPALSSRTNSWVAEGEEIPGNTTGGTEQAIKDGVLWPYTQSLGLYECKSARSYLSINSRPDRLRDYSLSVVMGVYPLKADGIEGYSFLTLTEIPRPAEKMVFIDADGGVTSELGSGQNFWWLHHSLNVLGSESSPSGHHYWKCYKNADGTLNINMITARHSNGCNLSFADGHCEYWKYKDLRTVKLANGKISEDEAGTSENNADIKRMAKLLEGRWKLRP